MADTVENALEKYGSLLMYISFTVLAFMNGNAVVSAMGVLALVVAIIHVFRPLPWLSSVSNVLLIVAMIIFSFNRGWNIIAWLLIVALCLIIGGYVWKELSDHK
ncbi:hypothetical protein EML15_08895 [Corynebacterium sp. sy017]|uniref:hypothetical protein n=1 Tax=unclassified Corynebacterium TaxID=2624378 RepID=UPI001186323C|nr:MULTISPECIES: hypothetical protein [unclassified Corynebacterium]MBP3089261.1 hypothetical protein [Corynebacterium sp. sy017]TSD91032.1 hypothetical protein ELY17_09705 [Corynebacterium sp. SY003]